MNMVVVAVVVVVVIVVAVVVVVMVMVEIVGMIVVVVVVVVVMVVVIVVVVVGIRRKGVGSSRICNSTSSCQTNHRTQLHNYIIISSFEKLKVSRTKMLQKVLHV